MCQRCILRLLLIGKGDRVELSRVELNKIPAIFSFAKWISQSFFLGSLVLTPKKKLATISRTFLWKRKMFQEKDFYTIFLLLHLQEMDGGGRTKKNFNYREINLIFSLLSKLNIHKFPERSFCRYLHHTRWLYMEFYEVMYIFLGSDKRKIVKRFRANGFCNIVVKFSFFSL